MLPKEIKIKFWKNSFYISLGIYIAWIFYNISFTGGWTFGVLNQSLSVTSAVMIALSFIMGTVTYYTNFLDARLAYRKYLGLVGYWYLVVFLIIYILADTQEHFKNIFSGRMPLDTQLGLVAFGILTLMMAISHERAMRLLGPKLWRNVLRTGYLIYIVLIPRAWLLEGHLWTRWTSGEGGYLPPASLVVSVLGIMVILFRLSAFPTKFIHKIFGTRKEKLVITYSDHIGEPSHPDQTDT